ncbi:protein OBERON 4-like [Aristolochia californica]|uniref:protein OBERON 4-like n=1 Tax=Aristolochia californica TaxID=171875 RepID=UPI0035D5ADA3
MKRPRSYGEDLDAIGDKSVCKDWGRRDQESDRSSSHRRFYLKTENGRKGSSSSSAYDRSLDEDREVSRASRKRFDHESDGFDRRKSFERYRDCGDRVLSTSSPRNVYGTERIHRSESFSSSRRDFPKGFRSDRERSRREDSDSSWRRPSANKDSDEDMRFGVDKGNRLGSEDRGSVRSPPGHREAVKSPQWSKDSSGERSKSVETKKSEETHVETKKSEETHGESGNSSEMEEGELEPEQEAEPEPAPEPEPRPESEPDPPTVVKSEVGEESQIQKEALVGSERNPQGEENFETDNDKLAIFDVKQDDGTAETIAGEVEEIDKALDDSEGTVNDIGAKQEVKADENEVQEEKLKEETLSLPSPEKEETTGTADVEKVLPLEEESKESKDINLEVQAEENDSPSRNKESVQGNGTLEVVSRFIANKLNTDNGKDKGKRLAVVLSHEGNSIEDSGCMGRDPMAGREDPMEGPSTSGFKLFFSSDLTKQAKVSNSGINKKKEEKLKMEPLELSLGLPNVSVAPSHENSKQGAKSPSHGRSAHSLPTTTFRTNSDGFTASISFSGSQTFIHNPSCSLTQNSFENFEQSVGSHPIFQGIDQVSHGSWHAQYPNDTKLKEVSLYQRAIQNGSGALNSSQVSPGILNGQSGTAGVPSLDRQASLQKQMSGHFRQEEVRSPSQSIGSHDARSEHSRDCKRILRERNSGGVLFRCSQGETEQFGPGVAEWYVAKIILDPIQSVARVIKEMPEQSVVCLKESVSEMIENELKLRAMQEMLQRRSDLTLEALASCHRVQLEILVALRTGLRDFLRRATSIPSPDLVEIFLNLKCRNLACSSILPVEECDCKVCSQKNGFCSACMCIVCSKFDMASNTCSWVGCDVCVHWCHTDCALRGAQIRNGRSITGSHGTTEMQFFCVACDHPSEMFGFVKEVFKTCAKEWKAETLYKELEYVKRIFCASEDARGKQLHDVAIRMLSKLENKSSLPEVFNCINGFMSETDYNKTPSFPIKEPPPQKNPGEGSNVMAGPTQEPAWLRPASTEKAPTAGGVPMLDWEKTGARRSVVVPELLVNVEKKPIVDELESIVRIKQAEAKMFQARADDARREAEGLKRIAIAKNEKIEEEYASRITKLRLVETEERRRQKLEEFQVLERAHLEYFNMKVRMEADIKDLLLKMEATKRNLST